MLNMQKGGDIINKMLKPTIISISMATVMAGAAISPALGVIAEAFPQASPTMIKLILTAPAIMIIPFTFFTSFLTTRLRKKTIVIIGVFIYLIGGLAPQFATNIETLILLRLVLGAGVGLLMPLSESLIYDYFVDEERTKMMGYNSAFSNFGGIITILLAGWLASYGWRTPFNVYLLGIFIFVLVFLFLPKGEVRKPSNSESMLKIPMPVYGYSLAMGLIMLAYYSVSTNMALYLGENNMGGPEISGIIVSLLTVGGMITSLFLLPIKMTFKTYIVPVMLLAMGLSFFFLAKAKWLFLIMIAVCFIGFGQGVLFPVLTMKVLDSVPLHQTDKALAVATSFIFTGQFLSPIILDNMGLFFNQLSIRFQFMVLAFFTTSFALVNFLIVKKARN